MAMFITTYSFLLRLPSECLPLMWCAGELRKGSQAICVPRSRRTRRPRCGDHQAAIAIGKSEARIWLPRRKNRPFPTELVRECWCRAHRPTCPVHSIAPFFRALEDGDTPFSRFHPSRVRKQLRRMLSAVGVPDAHKYRTHDIRRGHADDILKAGAPVSKVRERGD